MTNYPRFTLTPACTPAGAARAGRSPAWAAWGLVLIVLASLGALLVPTPVRAQAGGQLSLGQVEQLAKRTRPSMVTVVAQRTVSHKATGREPASKRTHNRVGSGVAIEKDGILTTASVVIGAQRVLVVTDNGIQVAAQVVGFDPVMNVALLRVPGLTLSPVRFASRPPEVGDPVVALGSSYRAAPTQSVGRIAYRFREPRSSLLQLTNEVYPGNSGGAALDARGELMGLVQGELGTPEAPGQRDGRERRPGGMSFVIPVEDIRRVYADLKGSGRVHHGFLGVSTRAAFVDSDTQPGLRVPIGALVEGVQSGGPAARVGIVKGDLIVAFDGERIEYPTQLARWVAQTRPGRTARLVWVHDELQRDGQATLGESPTVIPSWMQADSDAQPVATLPRADDLQHQIDRLSRELKRLKGADSAR
ncbi:MAG: S1C family serine protease [Candidatus Eisenbacteria bacterium]